MKKLIVVLLSFVLMIYCNVFANTSKNIVVENNIIPVIYSGKYYDDINTAKITIRDFNVLNGLKFSFPEGIKIIAYQIDKVKGIEGIKEGFVKANKENSNPDLNTISINGMKPIPHKISEITFSFQIIVSPEYNGDIFLSVDQLKEGIIIASSKAPIKIEAESVRKTPDERKSPETSIVIQENYAGALEEKSKLILKTEYENMLFYNDFKLEVLEGNIDVDYEVKDDMIIITINKRNSDIPVKMLLSNVSIYFKEKEKLGKYGLYSVAINSAQLNEQNNIISKSSEAMFETYSIQKKEFSPTFPINKIKVKKDFICVEYHFGVAEERKIRNNISFKIGSDIIYIDEKERVMNAAAYISDEGYIMLPLRDFVEALTFDESKILWNPNENRAIIAYGVKLVSIALNSKNMIINNNEFVMYTSPKLLDNKLFVSLMDICYAFNIEYKNISWNSEKNIVTINMHEEEY